MKKTLLSLFCACMLLAAPARAQQATPPIGYKDPGTATLMSVAIPGGGQLYSGDMRKGFTLLGVGLGGLTLGVAMTTSSVGVSCDDDFSSCQDDTNYVPAALGYLAYFGSWIYGIMDASDSAHRMNAQRGLARVIPENVAPVVALDRSGGTQVGLTVRF